MHSFSEKKGHEWLELYSQLVKFYSLLHPLSEIAEFLYSHVFYKGRSF